MDEVPVQCPFCFEWVTIEVEIDARGVMVQDCEVCCRPWQVRVARDENGQPVVQLERS